MAAWVNGDAAILTTFKGASLGMAFSIVAGQHDFSQRA
jgi:hypothetical protein